MPIELLLFALPLVSFAATIWSSFRIRGLVIVALANLLAAWWRPEWRVRLGCRIVFVLITLITASLMRESDSSFLVHRYSRLIVIVGLAATAILSFPDSWYRWLERRSTLSAAMFAVILPSFGLLIQTNSQIGTGDSMPLAPTVVSQWQHGTRDLSRFVEQMPGRWSRVYGPDVPYFVWKIGNGYYSAYPAGMELFVWPAVIAADLSGFLIEDDAVLLWIEKITAATVTSIALGVFFALARTFVSFRAAWIMTALLATGSTFLSTLGLLLWQHDGVVLWSLVLLLLHRHAAHPVWLGLAAAMMFACRLSSVTFLLPFGIWLFSLDRRRALGTLLAALVGYLPWAITYLWIYGSPLGPSVRQAEVTWRPLQSLVPILFSPSRGLLIYQPFLALLMLYALPMFRKVGSIPRDWILFLLLATVLHLVLIASWPIWWGGACYGSRLLSEVVPLLALLVLPIVERVQQGPCGRLLLLVLAIVGFLLHAPCVFYEGWAWNILPNAIDQHPARLWDWSDTPFYRL